MSRQGPRVSPIIWVLYVLYACFMYLVATDFSPFSAPAPAPPSPKKEQAAPSMPYEVPIPCDLSPKRTAVVYIPPRLAKNTSIILDVLIGFHAKGKSGWFTITGQTGWSALADRHDLALVFGMSTGGAHRLGGPNARWKSESSDFEYFRSLLTYVKDHIARDGSRIFITGIANGGFFASDLIQRFPEAISGAYLAMAGLGRITNLNDAVAPSAPIFFSVGSNDPTLSRVENAINLYKKAGHPTKVIIVPGVSHQYQASKEEEILLWLKDHADRSFRSKRDLEEVIRKMDIRDYWTAGCDAPGVSVKGWRCGADTECYTSGKEEDCAGIIAWMQANQLSEKASKCLCPPKS